MIPWVMSQSPFQQIGRGECWEILYSFAHYHKSCPKMRGNCLTRQWQKRMRPRNDGSLQCRVIPWNGNVSFIGDLGKRHQLPWMSRSVCTSDCVVIDHRLVWLLPFTKKALEHLEKGSQNHQPWTMTIKQSLIKSLVCSNTACDISSLSSHRDSCRISNSLIISEIYVTCAFLKSHTVRSQESGPLGA